jgi:hypothetical protein
LSGFACFIRLKPSNLGRFRSSISRSYRRLS